ncbi:hypothetical protein DNTS_018063 [Danionella cerebrum]|uniref:Uncharacterized protein n=1 Tax=Danionella cerebrum TaxID=2873325 RepID=A0A553QGT1_9TELE|nr:hypothetical protein DNTS_018063 [Danionella translucida]
MEAKDRMRR